MPDTKVIIMRGLPGSGKSTYLRKLDKESERINIVCSADNYPGLYDAENNINFALLSDAHDYCFAKFLQACGHVKMGSIEPEFIAVDNTNTQLFEMSPYRMVARAMNLPVEFVTLAHKEGEIDMMAARNSHNVPGQTLWRMHSGWAVLPSFWENETKIPVG